MKIGRKKVLLPLSLFIVFLLLGAAWWWQTQQSKTSNTSLTNTLMQQSPAFVQATAAVRQGDYQQAVNLYQSALRSTTDPYLQVQIQYDIANATYGSGDIRGAVDVLKEIASSSKASNIEKAYAVARMGAYYYINYDPSVTRAIFGGEPYASMFVSDDLQTSYMHLFEYASSFYPAANSEAYLAALYASKLEQATSSSVISSYMTIINQKLVNANADIARNESDPYKKNLIASALFTEANAQATLTFAGMASSSVAEAAYQKAIAAYDAPGLQAKNDGAARVYYAYLLAKLYGRARLSDIEGILQPIYGSAYAAAPVMTALKNALSVPLFKQKYAAIAQIDPTFAKLLLSLGWRQSDFSTR